MTCQYCEGRGYHIGYGCPGFVPIKMPCGICAGTGNVTDEDLERVERGDRTRKARIALDVSLREEAARLGISPVELSAMERGHRPKEEGKP